jgi:cold shock CspA family protein
MFKGTLKKWNDDKGYGFIRREGDGPDMFIHISALRGLNRRPRIGDVVRFRIVTENGKTRAADAEIEGMAPPDDNPGTFLRPEPVRYKPRSTHDKPALPPQPRRSPEAYPPRRGKHGVWDLLLLGSLVLMLGFVGMLALLREPRVNGDLNEPTVAASPPRALPAVSVPPEPAFKCEGKTHCSQMSSCEEAKFYLRNCLGTEMDGDMDGIPCENQLCGH